MAQRCPWYLAKIKRNQERRKKRRLELNNAKKRRQYAAREPKYMARIKAHNRRHWAKQIAQLTDKYLRKILNNHNPVKHRWPKEMIELKRAQLKLKRTNDNHKRTRGSTA